MKMDLNVCLLSIQTIRLGWFERVKISRNGLEGSSRVKEK